MSSSVSTKRSKLYAHPERDHALPGDDRDGLSVDPARRVKSILRCRPGTWVTDQTGDLFPASPHARLSTRIVIRHAPRMTPSLTDILCTRCGLCCDGSLLADVELDDREAADLEILGLEVEDGDAKGGLLLLPCGALRGTRCSIYEHRPSCCRTFECRLLQDARRGAVTVERATEIIAETRRHIGRVNELIASLGDPGERLPLKERAAEALVESSNENENPDATRVRSELTKEMAAVERSLRDSFLAPRAPRGRR